MSEPTQQVFLRVCQLYKTFDRTPAVSDISFSLSRGQILCLLGPSGCGKTTLLRLIAGLEKPDTGQILFEGQDISGIPPHRRDFGLMFQEFALFPHKNVGQNVAFGLQMKQGEKIETRVQEMLALVGLSGFEKRDVNSLSGGERQRVALARSLAPRPRLLMLDEPLGALDRALRERLMLEIRQILKKVDLTAIYVTHDQTEAFALADRVLVMNEGRIKQDATPEQLYREPATPFVARFLGFTNLLEATCLNDSKIKTALGTWPIPSDRINPAWDQVMVLIRPEAASLSHLDGITIEGEVVASLFRGRFYQLTVLISGQQLTFEIPVTELPPVGSQITLWLDPAAILIFGC